MKNPGALLLFAGHLLIGSTGVFADVQLAPAKLQVVVKTAGMTSVQFCELGECRDLGRRRGYSEEEWKLAQQLCADNSMYTAPVRDLFSAIVSLAGTYAGYALGSPALMLISVGFAQVIRPDGSLDNQRVASDQMTGARSSASQFTVTVDTFISLRSGIRSCLTDYAKYLQMQLFRSRCRSILDVKRCLVPAQSEPGDETI